MFMLAVNVLGEAEGRSLSFGCDRLWQQHQRINGLQRLTVVLMDLEVAVGACAATCATHEGNDLALV